VNGKVLIFRLQILGCDRDGKISTVVRMVNYLWEWDGDRENLMGMGRGLGQFNLLCHSLLQSYLAFETSRTSKTAVCCSLQMPEI